MNSPFYFVELFFLFLWKYLPLPLPPPPSPSWVDGLKHLDSLQRFCMEDYRAPGPAIIFIICRTMQNLCKLADRALRLPFCPIVCMSVYLWRLFFGICLFIFLTVLLFVFATSCTDCMASCLFVFCLSAFFPLTKLSVCLSFQVIALAWAASLCDYLVSMPMSVYLSWLSGKSVISEPCISLCYPLSGKRRFKMSSFLVQLNRGVWRIDEQPSSRATSLVSPSSCQSAMQTDPSSMSSAIKVC